MISVEGLVMPKKALTNLEILDAVRKLKIPRFRGVYKHTTKSRYLNAIVLKRMANLIPL